MSETVINALYPDRLHGYDFNAPVSQARPEVFIENGVLVDKLSAPADTTVLVIHQPRQYETWRAEPDAETAVGNCIQANVNRVRSAIEEYGQTDKPEDFSRVNLWLIDKAAVPQAPDAEAVQQLPEQRYVWGGFQFSINDILSPENQQVLLGVVKELSPALQRPVAITEADIPVGASDVYGWEGGRIVNVAKFVMEKGWTLEWVQVDAYRFEDGAKVIKNVSNQLMACPPRMSITEEMRKHPGSRQVPIAEDVPSLDSQLEAALPPSESPSLSFDTRLG